MSGTHTDAVKHGAAVKRVPEPEHPAPSLKALTESGYALPGDWYSDPAMLPREKKAIFLRSWQYAGLTTQIPQPGDFFLSRAGHVPVVVIRDESGGINAFVNVCAHRGHEVVLEPAGRARTFQCRYHGWTYGLDGALKAAPHSGTDPNIAKSNICLPTIRVATLGSFIFLNPDPTGSPVDDIFGKWLEILEATYSNLEEVLKPSLRREYAIDANWKVVVDNFNECYHCAINHPGLRDLLDVNVEFWTETGKYFAVMGTSANKRRVDQKSRTRQARPQLYEVEENEFDAHVSCYLWPNFIFSILPGGMVTTNVIVPLDTEHSLHVRQYCFADSVDEERRQDFIALMDSTAAEDKPLCESVQRGLASGFYRPGPLVSDREPLVRHFQRLVCHALCER